MSEYAVIRESAYRQAFEEQPPAYVLRIERETDASAMGDIVNADGKADNWSRAFDTAASYEWDGYGPDRKKVRTKPGRVRKERLLTRHPDIATAFTALEAAKMAWHAAEDQETYRAASAAFQEANSALEAERKRLEAEMRKQLAEAQAAKDAAVRHLNETRVAIYARQTEAAIAAAASPSPSSMEAGR